MMKILGTLMVALAASQGPAWAQQRIEERRPASPDALVEIENMAGSVRVIGWDRPEVEVKGTLGRGAESLDFSGNPRRIHIEVGTDGNPHGVQSDLEIRIPAGSRLEIESFSAGITVTDVKGSVRVENVNGEISVSGTSDEVDLETVNGGVEVSCRCTRTHAESVNGPVTVRGASGEIEASTVNGTLVVEGGSFDRATLETVNGSIRFEGELGPKASLQIESVGGSVELLLPAKTSADFSITSFSGSIANELEGTTASRTSKYASEKELAFSMGSGDASVHVNTLSGDVTLRKR